MDNNPLILLPAKARQAVYVGYGVIALVGSSTQVGYAAASIDNPTWLTVALAVIGFLAVPVGALAALNVSANQAADPEVMPYLDE